MFFIVVLYFVYDVALCIVCPDVVITKIILYTGLEEVYWKEKIKSLLDCEKIEKLTKATADSSCNTIRKKKVKIYKKILSI